MAYPTLAEVKAYVSEAGTDRDTLLQGYLDFSVALIEGQSGRKFVAEAGTRSLRPLEGCGTTLSTGDMLSVSAVAGDGVLLSPDSYYLLKVADDDVGFMVVSSGAGGRFSWDRYALVEVSGEFGYSSDCPDDVFGALLDMVLGLSRARNSPVAGAQTNRRELVALAQSAKPELWDSVVVSHRRFR